MAVIYLDAPYSYKSKSNEIGLSRPDNSEKEKKVKEERFYKVSAVAAKLYKAGFTVLSPLTETHLLHRDHGLDGDFEFWQKHNFEMIDRVDMVMVLTLPGWKESNSVQAKMEFARQRGKLVVFINEDLQIGG